MKDYRKRKQVDEFILATALPSKLQEGGQMPRDFSCVRYARGRWRSSYSGGNGFLNAPMVLSSDDRRNVFESSFIYDLDDDQWH